MDAYAHALLQSFADSSNLFPELLRARGPGHWTAEPAPSPKSTACCPKRQPPTRTRSGAPIPQGALDTTARAILGACFHNSVRPDPADGETARRRYADELGDMAIAYLLTPDRQGTTHLMHGPAPAGLGWAGLGGAVGWRSRAPVSRLTP